MLISNLFKNQYISIEINLQNCLNHLNVAMVLLNQASNVIVVYQHFVKIRVVIRTRVCCIQMHRVPQANAVISLRACHVLPALCAVKQKGNVTYRSIVRANPNIVHRIISNETQRSVMMEKRIVIRGNVGLTMINANCCGVLRVNPQNNVTLRI